MSQEARPSQVHFVTFADGSPDYRAAATRLAAQAAETCWFATAHALHRDGLAALNPRWFARHREFLENNPRGYGYWLWKPFVIFETLNRAAPDAIVVYADAGFEISPEGHARFTDYLTMARDGDLFAFHTLNDEAAWNKAGFLDHFGHTPEYGRTKLPQISAGLLFVRNSSPARNLIHHWMMTCADYDLINDDPMGFAEAEWHKEHRHDQSVLSKLVKNHGIGRFIPLEALDRENWNRGIYNPRQPFHLFRNRTGARRLPHVRAGADIPETRALT
jgi:hypothetical protein